MKILHLSYDDLQNPFAGGGQAKASSQIFSRLSKEHEILIVTGNYPNAKSGVIDGIKYKRLGLGSCGSLISILSYWFLLPLVALLQKEKYDIIIEYFTAPFSVSFVPLFAKDKTVGCTSFLNARKLSEKYKIPFHWIEEIGVKKYKYFISLTKITKKNLHKLNPQSTIKVIPRGIEKNIIDLIPKEKNYVLFLGRIDVYHKGLDLLIKAWGRVQKTNNTTAKLIIAGNGKRDDEIALRKLIEENMVSSSVDLIGQISGDKKNKLLSECLFVVYPSRYETFGNVALETIAAGKLLVVFDIDGFSYIPDGLCLKVKKIDDNHLAKSIIGSLHDSKVRTGNITKRKTFAKKFDWDFIAKEHEDFFNKIINTY